MTREHSDVEQLYRTVVGATLVMAIAALFVFVSQHPWPPRERSAVQAPAAYLLAPAADDQERFLRGLASAFRR